MIKAVLILEDAEELERTSNVSTCYLSDYQGREFHICKNLHPQKKKRNQTFLSHNGNHLQGTASVESTIASKFFQHFVSVLKEVNQSKF